MTAQTFVGDLASYILNPLLYLLFAAALLVFLWGIVEFLWKKANGGDDKSDGKKHMLAGFIGLFIMLTAFSIIGLVLHTFNIPWPPGSTGPNPGTGVIPNCNPLTTNCSSTGL